MKSFNRIDYIEFCVTDLKESKTFFEKAFGWEFNDYGPHYSGIKDGTPDGEMGGLTTDGDKNSSKGPLVVLLSDDLEKSLEATKQAGGKITKAIFDFPGGSRFEFQDPSGNELAVWTKK